MKDRFEDNPQDKLDQAIQDEEFTDKLHDLLVTFQEDLGRLAMDYDLGDDYQFIIAITMKDMIENTVSEKEHFVEFVNWWVEFMNDLYEEGMIEGRSPYDSPEEAKKDWEEVRE